MIQTQLRLEKIDFRNKWNFEMLIWVISLNGDDAGWPRGRKSLLPAQAEEDVMFSGSLLPSPRRGPWFCLKKGMTNHWSKTTLVALSPRKVYPFLMFFFPGRRSGVEVTGSFLERFTSIVLPSQPSMNLSFWAWTIVLYDLLSKHICKLVKQLRGFSNRTLFPPVQ